MEILNSDDESDNLSFDTEPIPMGVSATFQLPDIKSTNIHEREKIFDIMCVIFKYNGFFVSQTVVHKKETAGGGFIITFIGNDVSMTISTSPEMSYARFHMNTSRNYESQAEIFDIYGFLTEAFESAYDSKYVEFTEHFV